MSGDIERPRSPLHSLSARVVMAGVFLGAILALALSVTFSWGGDTADGLGSGLSPEADAAFHSPPGSCLAWSKIDAADAHKVDCAQPHLFEVTQVVDISQQYPASAPGPTLDQWQSIAQASCSDGAKTYLGRPLDPYGRLMVNILRPTPNQWNTGDRQLRCGLEWTGPGGGIQPTTGPAKGQQQAYVWAPGTCLGLNGKTVGDPVDCNLPHSYEIIATLDLAKQFTSGYPSQKDQKAWLDTQCSTAADAYDGKADLSAKKLILTWDVREQESWDAGSTLVNCKVAATLPDKSGLAPVTGSIKGVAGTGGDAPPPAGGAPASNSAPPSGSGG